MTYVFSHSTMSFDATVILALIILAAVLIFVFLRHRSLRRKRNSLKNEIASLYTDEAMSSSGEEEQG